MFTKQNLAATLVATVTMFVLGYLIWGFATVDFFEKHTSKKMVFLSSHGTKSHYEISFEEELFLVFGKESKGLPATITSTYPDQLYTIPMFSEHIRSFNLANAVGIVVYEGIRQLSTK